MASPDTGKSGNQRSHTRTEVQLPISINEEQGFTRDVSASGMFIVQGHQQKIGSHIEFWVDLDTPGGTLKLCCEGEVSRIEEVDGQIGIGIKILKQFGMRLVLENLRGRSAH